MGPAFLSARKLIIAGAFTLAATVPSVAPVLVTTADLSAQQGCSNGEESDLYTGACIPYLTPNTHGVSSGMCPPGVSGSECAPSATQAGPQGPNMPAPPPPSLEEQDLADVVTPGY